MKRFANLDSIRSIAFLSTFFAHAFYSESVDVMSTTAFKASIYFQQVFSFGVPVFFVLSGFLISYLILNEHESNGRFSIKSFYMRRVLRIWPLYYLILVIGFIVFPVLRSKFLGNPHTETANPLMYALFLSNFDQLRAGELPYGVGLGPTWSVAIEEQFYLLWPLLFFIFPGRKFAIAILSILFISFTAKVALGLPGKHTLGSTHLLAIGSLYGYVSFYYRSFTSRISAISNFLLVVLWLALPVLIYISIKYPMPLLTLMLGVLMGYLILQQAHASRWQLKHIPFLERMGKYTYGLYLYHVVCNFIVYTIFIKILSLDDSSFSSVLVRPLCSLILSVFLSILSYKYFESFFLRLKEKFNPMKRQVFASEIS